MAKTFAEKLKEQTNYCDKLTNEVGELMAQAKESKDIQEAEQLLDIAGKLMETVTASMSRFEAKHKSEFIALAVCLDTKEKS